jgi:hypothetical protein
LSLTGSQLLAHRRVGGDRAHRLRHLAAADVGGRIDAVDDDAVLRDRQLELPRQIGDGRVVGDGDAATEGSEGHCPVHRAGVEVLEPEAAGDGAADSALPGTGRAIDRDQDHQDVPSGRPSS